MSESKYLVLKWDDINQLLNQTQREPLMWAISQINYGRQVEGKSIDNEYLVVNKDEPYADKVQALIEDFDLQKVDDMRKRVIEHCDGIIHTSAGGCLADKEIQILTNYDGDFPSKHDMDRHVYAVYDTTHDYSQTWHRATNNPRNGQIKTRLMVGQADLMLNQKQVDALNITEMNSDKIRPVEILLTPSAPQQRRNTDV